MRLVDYEVPAGDGELLADPAPASWPALGREVAALSAGWSATLCGTPLRDIRRRARAEAMTLAAEYTRELGLDPGGPYDPDGLIAVTGHQPVLAHPGVWAKNLLIDDLASSKGWRGINLVVDNDAVGAVCANVPHRDAAGTLGVDHCCLVRDAQDVPYESLPAPSPGSFEQWVGDVSERLATAGIPGASEAFEAWSGHALEGLAQAVSMGDFMTRARRAYEGVLGTTYLELPVSRLAGGDGFLGFALDLCGRAGELRVAYNAALAEYRALREIRSPANPLPDLDIDGDMVEMPFWIVTDDGRREALWVGRRGATLVLNCGSCTAIEVDSRDIVPAVAALREKGVAIRPKALTLTLFVRLFIADLFLHGIGGGKYDVLTDELMRAAYGIGAPPYAVASMTVHLPLGRTSSGASDQAALGQDLIALKHNPDKALEEAGELDAETAGLVARKRELVRAIAEEGADKKSLGAEIRRLNEELQAHVAPLIEETQVALEASKARAREAEIARYRDWAYCFFAPSDVRSALDAALGR
jgi:hypothetical protein